ncbi:MAG: VOC family protein, partial [Pseudonocardiaceae bacterium]
MADVDSAVGYYERFLGFRVRERIADPPAAVVERDGSAIMFRRREPNEPARSPGDREYPAWDAIVPVLDFDLTFEDLAVRAVSLQSPVVEHPLLGRTFTIEDRFGYLLCFAQAPGQAGAAIRRRANSARLRLRSARFARAATAELRPQLEEFKAFYARLEDKRDVFYTFFTGGLLHWALKAASFVPADVNLVFLGAELSAEEREWIAANVDRPFHYIDLPVNDWPVWDFLLEASDTNFGWLDIDCFVLIPDVFRDLAKVPPVVALN